VKSVRQKAPLRPRERIAKLGLVRALAKLGEGTEALTPLALARESTLSLKGRGS
jgi:hypothetical protein